MATLMQTMGRWAEGQNWLEVVPVEQRRALAPLLDAATVRLRRHASLGELASAFYADADWFGHLAAEFAIPVADCEPLRCAAHWARLMEIRHPQHRLHPHRESRR